MKTRILRAALLMLSVLNVGVLLPATEALACECTGAGGGKCTGACCKKLADGECQCADSPCS